MTTQAPHAIRTVFALVAGHVGLAEHKIRIISPDIGGGFGGKVPVYPGYVIAVAASVLTGKPVKWIEDRMENLQADSFARDYHITAELAAKKDGTLTALRIKTLADHGYTDAAANPSKFPAGLFHVCTGSYDLKAAHVEVDGVYTNKPPGGIAYRCSFRVTEAVHTIERMADLMAHQLGMDPAEFRMKNFIKPEQFPYKSALGWEYDSGNYAAALRKAMDRIGYADLRREQAEKRAARRADGHRHLELHRDRRRRAVEALRHPGPQDVRQLRDPHPSDRQGHRALRHQVAGAGARDHLRADPGRGAGHPRRRHPGRGRRHRHRALRPRHLRQPLHAGRRRGRRDGRAQDPGQGAQDRRPPAGGRRGGPRLGAGEVLGQGRARTRPRPSRRSPSPPTPTIPQGMEAGLEAVCYYDPPNLTYPFGSYICVVDIDTGTGEVKVRRFVAIDDCGNIINPMIVEGQIHGGLTMGLAPALFEEIAYDENGNIQGGSFIDYLLPTAVETPKWETGNTVTPSPHHPLGAKGVGESATVGAPAAIANAVVDALWHLGVRHIDIPITPAKVWKLLREHGVTDWRQAGRLTVAGLLRLRISSAAGSRSRSPPWCGASGPPRPSRGRRPSSAPTAPWSAGWAARARSPWCSARRSPPSRTASRGSSGSSARAGARRAAPKGCWSSR